MVACDSGTRAAPQMPCRMRKVTICASVSAVPHSIEAMTKPDHAGDVQVLAAEAHRHPAHRRGHDRGGDDVGGQHPGDLIRAGGQRALHVGQRDIGDGGIQRLHQVAHHHAHRDQGAMGDSLAGARHQSGRFSGRFFSTGLCAVRCGVPSPAKVGPAKAGRAGPRARGCTGRQGPRPRSNLPRAGRPWIPLMDFAVKRRSSGLQRLGLAGRGQPPLLHPLLTICCQCVRAVRGPWRGAKCDPPGSASIHAKSL